MEKYEGTKRLGAKPMTRGEYNAYRGWLIPSNEDPADAGYLVEYEDGGAANDTRHAGYISWSPADVFERSYKPLPRPDLAPHQQRVVMEADALETKLKALDGFLVGPIFGTLALEEQYRLTSQANYMESYARVLRDRIAAF